VTVDDRLPILYGAVRELGCPVLVMGGHAVRFYGIDRTTIDYDLHVLVDDVFWNRLGETLSRSPTFASSAILEGSSWRPAEFRRFIIGRLPDGREERLEFWRRNHLLAPFEQLWTRRSETFPDGRAVAFLGIDDLIRSKETEREDDWRDIALLEEIADERHLFEARDRAATADALSRLRSRRGYDRVERTGLLTDSALLGEAWERTANPVTMAYLAPSVPPGATDRAVDWVPAIRELIEPIRRVSPGSARHLALVEAARRLYRREAMAADRADKERAATNREGDSS
jgi:hypothetical protein